MNPALWTSKTGVDAQQHKLDTISNNLANVSTTGFKRDRAIFEDLVYQNVRQPGAQTTQDTQLPSGLMLGTGVRTVATQKLHTQGSPIATDNSLDVAIEGKGFFQVLRPNGEVAYTRDGQFQVNSDGQLVTSNGYQVQPGINIPQDAQSVDIGSDGTVSVKMPGQAEQAVVGNLETVDFINPTGLEPIGENQYVETAASGAPQAGVPGQNGLGQILQGYVEGSNVNAVEELVNMIETQRAYEMNSKGISTADQMLQYVNQNL
ncbi:MAG: flagellar basal-body rod protein FlgG [Pseudomonadota bacterium]